MGFQADLRWTLTRPLGEPMACDVCGLLCSRDRLDELQIRVLSGITGVQPDRCEPAEYATECPGCGCRDSFQPAIVCAECGRRPCDCADPSPCSRANPLHLTRGDLS